MELLRSEIPEVTSPLARRIINEVYRHAPAIPIHRTLSDHINGPAYLDVFLSGAHAYRHSIRGALYSSDLAQQLAAPDILLLPQHWVSPLQRLNLFMPGPPKTYPQLIRLVIQFLDWFVDPFISMPGYSSLKGAFSRQRNWIQSFSDRDVVEFYSRRIHAAELYYYLLDAYSDPVDEKPAEPHPVSLLLRVRELREENEQPD